MKLSGWSILLISLILSIVIIPNNYYSPLPNINSEKIGGYSPSIIEFTSQKNFDKRNPCKLLMKMEEIGNQKIF